MKKKTEEEEKWNDEKWQIKVDLLEVWINDHPAKAFEATREMLQMQIKRGNGNIKMREKSWLACLLEMRDIDDSPVGNRMSVPQEVQTFLDKIHPIMVIENTNPDRKYSELCEFRRASTGKGDKKITIRTRFMENEGVDKGTAIADGKITMLVKAYNDKIWDGTEKGLQLLAIPHPIAEVKKNDD